MTDYERLLDALEAMVRQYCGGGPGHEGVLSHDFMSAPEAAFEILEDTRRIEQDPKTGFWRATQDRWPV